MSAQSVGFGGRLVLFFLLPWRVLFDGLAAWRVQAALDGKAALPEATPAPEKPAEPAAPPPPAAPVEDPSAAALQLLSLLQRDGRLVDFLQEDVTQFSDAEVGAAARTVHQGCRKTLAQYFELKTVRAEEEGAHVTVPAGFDPKEVLLTGNVSGEPPFSGVLAHPGWRVALVKLPERAKGHDLTIIAPAEVEL